VVKEERLADTPRGKQGQGPSGLSPKQCEITLREAGTPDFKFVECFHGPIVASCRKNRNCQFCGNERQQPGSGVATGEAEGAGIEDQRAGAVAHVDICRPLEAKRQ
jgi:hypothetical protein